MDHVIVTMPTELLDSKAQHLAAAIVVTCLARLRIGRVPLQRPLMKVGGAFGDCTIAFGFFVDLFQFSGHFGGFWSLDGHGLLAAEFGLDVAFLEFEGVSSLVVTEASELDQSEFQVLFAQEHLPTDCDEKAELLLLEFLDVDSSNGCII